MKSKKKLIEGKTYWNLYEFRLRGVFLLDIVSQGSCNRTDIELGKIIKAPTALVRAMVLQAGANSEIIITYNEDGVRFIDYAPKLI